MLSFADVIHSVIKETDSALRTLFPPKERATTRHSPAKAHEEVALNSATTKNIAGLMRVNHAGEVCAQALYQGQALTANLTDVKQQMRDAALEEVDHLGWCEERLQELNSHTSVLNPVWYAGSFLIGAMAGLAGDKISLGFVAETERQVTTHLQSHLDKIPVEDRKTKSILELMQQDEQHHADVAMQAGAWDLPSPIKQMMSVVSKIMTKTSYYI